MYSGSRTRRMRPQPGRIHTAGRIGRDDIGDQTLVTGGVLTGHDRDLADPLMGGEYGFDLAGLDPEPADLDLVVGASQVSSRPSRFQRATSPVRYIRSPAVLPNGQATNRSAVSPARPR